MTKTIPLSRAATKVAALLSGSLLAWASPACAFTPADSKTATGSGESTPLNLSQSGGGAAHTSSGGASLVRTIVGLAIVIAVIWGLSWILRQVKAGREPRVATTGLSSVAALTLASGRSVHLVRAGNDYLLLGSGEHGLTPIHRYTEQQAREAGLLPPDEPPEPRRRRLALPAVSATSDAARPQAMLESGERRTDPMRMPSSSASAVERLREWTVRR
jgi:flagellar protein FliO/FliZ